MTTKPHESYAIKIGIYSWEMWVIWNLTFRELSFLLIVVFTFKAKLFPLTFFIWCFDNVLFFNICFLIKCNIICSFWLTHCDANVYSITFCTMHLMLLLGFYASFYDQVTQPNTLMTPLPIGNPKRFSLMILLLDNGCSNSILKVMQNIEAPAILSRPWSHTSHKLIFFIMLYFW